MVNSSWSVTWLDAQRVQDLVGQCPTVCVVVVRELSAASFGGLLCLAIAIDRDFELLPAREAKSIAASEHRGRFDLSLV